MPKDPGLWVGIVGDGVVSQVWQEKYHIGGSRGVVGGTGTGVAERANLELKKPRCGMWESRRVGVGKGSQGSGVTRNVVQPR